MKKHISQVQAILLAIAGYTSYNLYDVGLKLAAEQKFPVNEILGMIGIFSIFILLFTNAARGKLKNLKPKNTKMVVLRAMLGMGTAICVVFSLPLISLTNFYTIIFAAPFIVSALAALVLRERVTWQKLLAIFLGFMGVIVAIDPEKIMAGQGSLSGYFFAFLAVLFFSCAQVTLRHISQTENPESIMFVNKIFYSLGLCLTFFGLYKPISWEVVITLFLAALIHTFGDFLIINATKNAPAATIAPCHYWQIIPGALLGYFIWDDKLSWNLALGALIIIGAGLEIARQTRKQQTGYIS